MRYTERVQGSQTSVLDVEHNGGSVYVRAGIERYARTDEDGRTDEGWVYDEVQMTETEWQRLLALDSGWVRVWSDAMRVAERRARYERMDPVVSSIRRRIDLGIDTESNTAKLKTIQTYLNAVHETVNQATYPTVVEYPDEPAL